MNEELYLNQKWVWDWPPRDPALAERLAAYYRDGEALSIAGRSGILEACEEEWESRMGVRHALLCSSGTMALYSAYFAANLSPGDEVICPTITYHATATPALHLGLKIVLVDCESDTGNIQIDSMRAALTPRTRMVVTNAMWGHPVEQSEVRSFCDQHGLLWLEDFSHAHFSVFQGKLVGTWGDMACASLQGQKFISGGEGGLFVCQKDSWMDRAVLLGHNLIRSASDVRDPKYKELGRTGYGLKLRIHPLAALIIHHQLVHHSERWLAERHDSLTRLSAALSELPGLEPPVVRSGVDSMGAWYGYKPRIREAELGTSALFVSNALQEKGFDIRPPASPCLHQLALFDPDRFPVTTFPKASLEGRVFPSAECYHQGLLSVDPPTGPRDEAYLQALILAFKEIWEENGWR